MKLFDYKYKCSHLATQVFFDILVFVNFILFVGPGL